MPNTHEMSIKPVRAARITDTTGALLGESRVRRRPRNTVKNDVFEHFSNIQRKIHKNLSGGFGRGSTRGLPAVQQKGRRQGRRAYITFGYQPKASGKDTGPWPAPGFKGCRPCRRPRDSSRSRSTAACTRQKAMKQTDQIGRVVQQLKQVHFRMQ